MRQVITDAGQQWQDICDRERSEGTPQIHMKIRFGYGSPDGRVTWLRPIYYYYRTADHRVVLDVAGVERQASGLGL